MRKSIINFFHSKLYTVVLLLIIFINCTTLGLSTVSSLQRFEDAFDIVDDICCVLFVCETIAKLYAFRTEFFTGKWRFWNIFDALIIFTTIGTPHNILILRGLRAFRVLRLVSFIPSMRFVCIAISFAVPQIISIAVLLLLVYYIYGVLCYELFAATFPQYFVSLESSFFTLFCIMTLDGGSSIIKDVMSVHPYSWVVFLSFILISTFIIMNLIIALIVNNLDEMRKKSAEPIDWQED